MKVEDLIEQLERSPETEISGVVKPGGVGRMGDTVLITLAAWKPAGGALQKSELVLRKNVSTTEFRTLRESVPEYGVVRVCARLCENTVLGSPQALLVHLIGADDADPELCAHARDLQAPVTFRDPLFGTFTLDRRVGQYEAETLWKDHGIRVSMCSESDRLENSLHIARRLWGAQHQWEDRITAHAAKELLGVKNECWLEQGEPSIEAEEFVSRMVIESISIERNGSFEFWFEDGDLFWGHYIVVSGSLKEGPTEASIYG